MSDILIPDPIASDRQFARFHHFDLPGLDDTEAIDELHHLRPLLWGLSDDHWLRERVKALETELAKRRGDTSYKTSGKSKLRQAEGVAL